MKKFCKIIAVIMAVMMPVTMATACKNSDDEFCNDVFSGTTVGSESTDEGGTDPAPSDQEEANKNYEASMKYASRKLWLTQLKIIG